ncbi:sorbosone dehydrogenase family protein [Caloramator sp. ALD01]|uniref:PQQ-dependent sugar dehydrogenase n=1 Tax=Caloramator sp. ALD01 TaxID=1031288 RepID=UPI000426F4A7|nr:hypothetical protein [Caloramator sp. ALD01]
MKNKNLFIILILVLSLGILSINFLIRVNEENSDITNKLIIQDGYNVKKLIEGLIEPTSFAVDANGNIYIAERIGSEVVINKYYKNGKNEIWAKGFNYPITSILVYKDYLLVSHKGMISKVIDNKVEDIITGLPSYGDYSNNGIQIGYDGYLYICQGSATNSGVVGLDNYERGWLKENPYFHDFYPVDVVLSGINFKSSNPMTESKNDKAITGAFMPFNMQSSKDSVIKGKTPGNASIYRTYVGSTNLDLFAYGIRNPINIIFTHDNKAYVSVQGMENRGQRPIENGCDYIYEIKKGDWLGWPDYEGGEPVTLKKFKPKNASQPQFITEMHPTTTPPKPLIVFNESGRIGAMDISRQNAFGYVGNLFIPLKSGKNEEAKIVAYDIKGNLLVDFIKNKEEKIIKEPIQCSFSKDGILYILDKGNGCIYCVEKVEEKQHSLNRIYIPVEYLIGTVVIALIVILILQIRKTK